MEAATKGPNLNAQRATNLCRERWEGEGERLGGGGVEALPWLRWRVCCELGSSKPIAALFIPSFLDVPSQWLRPLYILTAIHNATRADDDDSNNNDNTVTADRAPLATAGN